MIMKSRTATVILTAGVATAVCAVILAATTPEKPKSETPDKEPSVGQLALATPVIKDWSSTGGKTRNKTGPKDIMYLTRPGDKITFEIKAQGTKKYAWRVNKKTDKSAAGSSLTWTVPNEKGIWEIHLKMTGGGKEAHHEWVVSTLSKKEAPDFFDYFADKKLCNRTETDPWGRPLPEWIVTREYGEIDVSKCCLQPPAESVLDNEGNAKGVIYYPWKHPYNTWKFRYMAPNGPHVANGGWTHFRYSFLHFPGSGHKPFMYLRETSEAHGYFGSGAHHFDHDKGIYNTRGRWYNASIVQTKNNDFACYREGKKEFSGQDPRGKTCTGLSLRMYSYRPDLCPNSKINVDCLEIWKDKVLKK